VLAHNAVRIADLIEAKNAPAPKTPTSKSKARQHAGAGPDADRGSSPLSITEIPQLTAGVGAR
jgi:hypothetical protein